jgi:hypothetical protein
LYSLHPLTTVGVQDKTIFDVGVVFGFSALWFRRCMSTFWRSLLSPFSKLKSLPLPSFATSALKMEAPKRWHRSAKPQGTKTQDNTDIILIALRTLDLKAIFICGLCMTN